MSLLSRVVEGLVVLPSVTLVVLPWVSEPVRTLILSQLVSVLPGPFKAVCVVFLPVSEFVVIQVVSAVSIVLHPVVGDALVVSGVVASALGVLEAFQVFDINAGLRIKDCGTVVTHWIAWVLECNGWCWCLGLEVSICLLLDLLDVLVCCDKTEEKGHCSGYGCFHFIY
jgi:hypothetical protein